MGAMPCRFITCFVGDLEIDEFICSFGFSAVASVFALLEGAWAAAAFLLARVSFLGGMIRGIKLWSVYIWKKNEEAGDASWVWICSPVWNRLLNKFVGNPYDVISTSCSIFVLQARFWYLLNLLIILHTMVLKNARKSWFQIYEMKKTLPCSQADYSWSIA